MNSKMRWKKLGLIFSPTSDHVWMKGYAAVPIAEHLHDNIFKIYFSSRDVFNRSHTAYIIIDLLEPNIILETSPSPVLEPGVLGEFDDSGAMATWLVHQREKRYLYYIGWNLGVTVPFRNSIGLSISQEGEAFKRYASGPILDRSMNEPHFCASCCVIVDNNVWKMWYLSCTEWHIKDGKPEHSYHIKYAESDDGIHWHRDGTVAIDFSHVGEYAISRPAVIKDPDRWRMWYSMRGDSYRIGYAESADGVTWQRKDELVGIGVSESGWDSEMIEYPYVFDHAGSRYMLYNGNAYGQTGMGLAVLEYDHD
ncbi:hypothetical protein [Pseudomonas sp. NPDC088444]|uniref:hypothetical protein n=1 Tax=Pseudomonas sp. NPDC088444 TaxID=3364456 RepID=UPI00384DFB7C